MGHTLRRGEVVIHRTGRPWWLGVIQEELAGGFAGFFNRQRRAVRVRPSTVPALIGIVCHPPMLAERSGHKHT